MEKAKNVLKASFFSLKISSGTHSSVAVVIPNRPSVGLMSTPLRGASARHNVARVRGSAQTLCDVTRCP